MTVNIQLFKNKMNHLWRDDDTRRLVRLILIGALLRVVLMPFFSHIDFFSEARRIYYWIENHIFFDNIARNTTLLIESMFLRVFSPFLPDAKQMLYFADIAHATSSPEDYFEFVSFATTFRTFFVLKIPYLVCDLLTTVVLYRLFENKTQALRCCKVWLFNPITIFSVYIFGRFESIPLLFLALSLLFVQKDKIVMAAVCFGLCLNARETMNLYLPIFIFAVLLYNQRGFNFSKKIITLSIVFVFAAIALQIVSIVTPVATSAGNEVVSVVKEGRLENLVTFNINGIIATVFVYGIVLIWIACTDQTLFEKLLLGYGLVMFGFFAFSSHTAHFTAWMIIFPAIYIGRDKGMLPPFIALCIAWVGYWSFLTDLGVFTTWLAAPFSLHAIEIPNIPRIFVFLNKNVPILSLGLMVNIFRTFFVAALAYLAAGMIRHSVIFDEKKLS